jgi:hypothetical protein
LKTLAADIPVHIDLSEGGELLQNCLQPAKRVLH